MPGYLDQQDEDEALQPLDEADPALPRPKPRWWEVAPAGGPPPVDGAAPLPGNAPLPDELPAAMPSGPTSVPGPRPIDERVRQKTAELEAAVGAKPKEGSPKWWQRLAAGAAGFGAGYVNADGKRHPQIDASGAVDTIMGGPQKRQRLSDWHDKVGGAELGLTGAEKERDAWFKGRQLTRQEDLADAQIGHTTAETGLVKAQTAAAEAGTKDQYLKVGDGVFDKKAGAWKVQPTNKNETMPVDPTWAKENLPMLSPDENGEYRVPIKGLDAILSNVTKKVAEPRISNPNEVLLNPEKFTPEQGKTADRMFKDMHRPPVTNFMNSPEGKDSLEEIAQSLASGNLSRIRDITSMRDSRREQLFHRTLQINPKFSTADLDRRIKNEDYYANGKGAANIQSFGTFLEHGGAAIDAATAINQGNPKLLNKPINWWKTNMSGDPAFQSFVVALEPVRKEFEGFLLGGRALYGDDRKQAEIILNDSSSLGQVQAALKQMGHTAQARMNEENFRYKKVSGHDLVDPFSPEALEGARKIGVNLGGGQHAPQQTPAPQQNQPQANPNPNGYVVGHVYGGLTYLGPDPNNPASWKK